MAANVNSFTLHVINNKLYCLVCLWHIFDLYNVTDRLKPGFDKAENLRQVFSEA